MFWGVEEEERRRRYSTVLVFDVAVVFAVAVELVLDLSQFYRGARIDGYLNVFLIGTQRRYDSTVSEHALDGWWFCRVRVDRYLNMRYI